MHQKLFRIIVSPLQKAINKKIMDKDAEINILKKKLLEKVKSVLLLFQLFFFFPLSSLFVPFIHPLMLLVATNCLAILSVWHTLFLGKILFFHNRSKMPLNQMILKCIEWPRHPRVRNILCLQRLKHLEASLSTVRSLRRNEEWRLPLRNPNHTHLMKKIKPLRSMWQKSLCTI